MKFIHTVLCQHTASVNVYNSFASPFLTCSDMSSIWLLRSLNHKTWTVVDSLLYTAQEHSFTVLEQQEYLVRNCFYFFTIWMTSSCSMMCVSPTLCGLYFVLVPCKHERVRFLKGTVKKKKKNITCEDRGHNNLPTPRHTWTGRLMFCEFGDTAKTRND